MIPLRRPLLHFVALGAGLFVATAAFDRNHAAAPGTIVVTAAQVAQLVDDFTRMNRRAPSAAERDALIGDHLRGEVAYREALALGLDRDDAVIRHRLREKIEFLFADVAALAEPSDAQLETYLAEHADAFRIEPRYTFEQVFLDPRRRADAAAGDAAALLARLDAGGPRDVGDPFLLDDAFEALPASQVASLFGDAFAASLARLTPGRWQGPIASGYGQHLVRVAARGEERAAVLGEVRDAVRAQWLAAQRAATKDALYAGLLSRYAVTIEPPSQ